MAYHWCDNVHTTVFTPRDYQVELLASAVERNTMVCLGHKSSKDFIALKLIQEMARELRSENKISLYLTLKSGESAYNLIYHLTDLKVHLANSVSKEIIPGLCSEDVNSENKICDQMVEKVSDKEEPYDFPPPFQVFIVNPRVCLQALRDKTLSLERVGLLVLEDCHEIETQSDMFAIFKEFYTTEEVAQSSLMPKVLALAGPLHSAGCPPQNLNAMLNILEESIDCKAETASDIVTVLRYCSKPMEFIVQCGPNNRDSLTPILEDIICTRKAFLNDHRYDPSEIYSTDDFLEELKGIPDPKVEPLQFLDTYLEVLHEMGPWCANRVAVSMLQRIEKQKIKTPYERHYLLLCLVTTTLFEIHTLCERIFQKVKSEKERVENFSSPKVLRLLETLRLFKPKEAVSENANLGKITKEIENLDFHKLKKTLENTYQTVEKLTRTESKDIIDNLDPIIQPLATKSFRPSKSFIGINSTGSSVVAAGGVMTNTLKNRRNNVGARLKKRPFVRRYNRENSHDSDVLCGIVFCNTKYTARVLFDLLVEMGRHDATLKFLKCQFTTDRVADPVTEPKEAELEHRRQEDVLKRFRMHDCNLLIGTSVLEEGMDLPKCNLVVRWDPPTMYRSYVQCKGRARSSQAYHIIFVAPKFQKDSFSCNNEELSDHSHRFICESDQQADNFESDSDSNEEEVSDLIITEELSRLTISTITPGMGTVKILNPEVITTKPPLATLALKCEVSLKEIKEEPSVNNSSDQQELQDISNNSIKTNASIDSLCSGKPKKKRKKSLDNFFEIIPINDVIAQQELNMENKPTANGSPEDSPVRALTQNSSPVKENETEKQITVQSTLDLSSMEEVNSKLIALQHKNISASAKKPRRCLVAMEPALIVPCPSEGVSNNTNEMELSTTEMVNRLAQYQEIEKMLLIKCANREPLENEHQHADKFTNCVAAYRPQPEILTGANVNLSTAIALVNKYCAKLPSDTFTKLTPLWRCSKTKRSGIELYQYTLRLPINSPLKYDIVGVPMPTKVLARRMAALQACKELHLCGELDNNLLPIGKEGFKAFEQDWENFELEELDEKIVHENLEPRPGTTKRRQYYYKRIASEFSNCRPTAGASCYLYFIDLKLQCPIPEEQNTRGRKIYPPEEANQGFGILTLKKIPKVSSFPIFTRSGEVKVSIILSRQRVVLNRDQIERINTFLNYTFTNVLRLQKFLMLFDPDSTENCIFIVPTMKTENNDGTGCTINRVIDWNFLELIANNCNVMPKIIPDIERKCQEFDPNKFKDAVVMPWYRNQDQPQYFYVAEICPQLTPLSCFPGENYHTFKHYYFLKYDITIQNVKQPLLDVDHTSARLNFLTPRYVNRKGVALPTSSEETKRAKRENLEQKQILVPELCTIHPFPASLWRAAVCLPCILYRINGLLLADDIRKKVSFDMGIGRMEIEEDDFEWPMLDFGWSLSEVLKKSKCEENSSSNQHIDQECNLGEQLRDDATISAEEQHEKLIAVKLEKSANDIVLEGEEKLKTDTLIEIGTWSNDMANNISDEDTDRDEDDDDYYKLLPPNVSFCESGFDKPTRYGSPTFWNVNNTSTKYSAETESNSDRKERQQQYFYCSDESFATTSSDEDEGPLRIEFTSTNVAEAIETEEEILKRQRQLSIIQDTTANERNYQVTKNLQVGFNIINVDKSIVSQLKSSEEEFILSTEKLKSDIFTSGMLVKHDCPLNLPKKKQVIEEKLQGTIDTFLQFLPYVNRSDLNEFLYEGEGILSIDDIVGLNQKFVQRNPEESYIIEGSGDIFDSFNDNSFLKMSHHVKEKRLAISYERHIYDQVPPQDRCVGTNHTSLPESDFSFDQQPNLIGHPGPSPSIILQALTMSNANDGINLERLETIGDSFLKFAITTYLYITYENVHEGKLSHLRSKQVANLNLYRLGRKKILGEYMIATKFEPHDNWLPPCYYVPKELERALIEAGIPPHHWKLADLPNIKKLSSLEICELVRKKAESLGLYVNDSSPENSFSHHRNQSSSSENEDEIDFTCFIPYNLVTQHSIPDKSVADCVEALIGAYLIECGPRGALLFMAWLGIRVLPFIREKFDIFEPRIPGSTRPDADDFITVYGSWSPPKSPLLPYSPNAKQQLEILLDGFDEFETGIGYKFRDRSYLLQAMTHASYSPNRLTDCYQRLEFLGDAVLDYLITRHLYEDPRQHSPGALTDLRSALVNNTIFASLAVRHGFHKYFRHLSPGLNEVIDRFVRIQHENGHSISEEYYLLSEEECDDAEDVEVPKALGDVFESIAGAIFLDSNMSLDVVWKVYSNMMKPEIEQFSNSVPKSPIRELLELEPETAKFGKPEKLADGRRVRVTVDVFCKGTYRGIGRNYRIAKCTAAKCALRQLKKQGLLAKKQS